MAEELAVRDRRYEIVAVEWPPESCQVTEHLIGLKASHPDLYAEVIAFLGDELPTGLPLKVDNRSNHARAVVPSWKELHEGISEFRLGSQPDPAYRVLWFRDGHRIVLTNAYVKPPRPLHTLQEAIALREVYFWSDRTLIEEIA